MKKSTLSPSSYIVLAFIARCGPMTSYDLKQWADGSVGHFWSFSRAQLYKEPVRLEKLGLLSEEKEEAGRRKRVYSLTDAGQQALALWLTESTETPVEIRDLGLLRLYFADLMAPEALQGLVAGQLASHQRKKDEYQTIQSELESDPAHKHFLATVEMGLKYEQASIEFWESLPSKS